MFLCLDRRPARRGRHRFGETRWQRRLGLRGRNAAVYFRQQQLQHALEQLRVAPEKVERLIEQYLLLVTLDQHRLERGAKVFPVVDTDRLDRFQRRDHFGRADRQPCLAQYPREMKDVLG